MLDSQTRLDDKASALGLIGYFDEPEPLKAAVQKVTETGCQGVDAFTPFPVHGLEVAQRLKPSILPFVTFSAGLTGCVLGFLLQYWTSVLDWPLMVGGKPFNSWPAFVPVMFECTILFAGLATAGGMFFLNQLPNLTQKAFDPGLTQDRFALFIPQTDLKHLGGEQAAQQLLASLGAQSIQQVYPEGWF